jgi:hypothetical protein
MFEMMAIYMAGVILTAAAFAARTPHQELRMVFLLSLFWPLSLVFTLFMSIIWAIKWDFDVAPGAKMFGFRKPTNPEVKGFGITLFKNELQFWKKRK